MQSIAPLSESFEIKQDRINRQIQLTKQYSLPIVLVTSYLPVELGNKPYNKTIFNTALGRVEEKLELLGMKSLARQFTHQSTGTEALLVIKSLDSKAIKKAMIEIESNHALGQFMNIDVFDEKGKSMSRSSCRLAPRTHLFRKKNALFVASSKKADVESIDKMIHSLL